MKKDWDEREKLKEAEEAMVLKRKELLKKGIDYDVEDAKGLISIWLTPSGIIFLTIFGTFILLISLIEDK